MGVTLEQLADVGCHDRARIDDREAELLRMLTRRRLDPVRLEPERRVRGSRARQRRRHVPRIDRELAIDLNFAFAERHAEHGYTIRVRPKLEIVAYVHGLDQKTEILRELAPHALDPAEQRPVLIAIDEWYEAVTDLETDEIDGRQIVPGQLGLLCDRRRLGLGRLDGRSRRASLQVIACVERGCAEAQESDIGHARQEAEQREDGACRRQNTRTEEDLLDDLLSQGLRTRHTRHDDRYGRREQQRRNLRNEPVADRQQRVQAPGLGKREIVLQNADEQPADDVEREDQDAGDGVAANEFTGTVHRAVKIRLLADFVTAAQRLFLRDDTGVQISVDGHLLAGHCIQREARRDFRNACRTLRDHDEVDDDEDEEDDQADRVVSADDDGAECLDDFSGGIRARVAFEQHDARRGDVEREPQ